MALKTLFDIMHPRVKTITAETPLSEALELMHQTHISSLVVEKNNKPIGLITERDAVFWAYRHQDIQPLQAKDAMTSPVLTAPQNLSYQAGYALIADHHIRHLIVVDQQGCIAGIVTEDNFLHHLSSDLFLRFEKVCELMKTNVITLPMDAKVQDAVHLLINSQTSCILVEHLGQVAGIFTEQDLLKLEARHHKINHLPLQQVMTHPVESVFEETALPIAIKKMDELNIRHLPVTNHSGQLKGLLTRHELVVQLYSRPLEKLQQSLIENEAQLKQLHIELENAKLLYQTQERLLESQKITHLGSWELQLADQTLWWSDEVYCIFELDSETTTPSYQRFMEAIHPDDRAITQSAYREALETHQAYSIDHRLLVNGKVKWINRRGKTRYDSQGNPVCSFGTIQDITQRKKTEQQLRDNEARFKVLFEAINEPLFVQPIMDQQLGCFEQVNEVACQKLGYSHQQLKKMRLEDLEIAETSTRTKNQPDGSQQGFNYESVFQPQSAPPYPVEISSHTFKFNEQDYRITLAQDITERKEQETQLRQAAAVFESSAESIVITDTQANIITVNRAFSDITGYHKHEVIGQNPSVLKSGRQDSRFYQNLWESLLAEGKWQGELWNQRKNGEVYPVWQTISTVYNDQGQAIYFVGIATDLGEIRQTEKALQHVTHHNPLTNLPNRLRLRQKIDLALERSHQTNQAFAVIQVNLDRFKAVNEGYGFQTGDKLLQAVASRILTQLPKRATLAHPTGDEFILIVEQLAYSGQIISFAENLLEQLAIPYQIEGHTLFVPATLGITLSPSDAFSADALIRNANSALHQAKTLGGNIYAFFSQEMEQASRQQIDTDTELRHALDQDQFIVYYQPQIDLTTSHMQGVEALIRWQHPIKGLISPDIFIPRAEQTGLIIPIGETVILKACQQMKQWIDQGSDIQTLAVNLSPRQFNSPNLVEHIQSVLDQTQLAPHHLELEITESGLMSESTLEQLHDLKSLGIQIAIDDFGTGHSSLSRLKHLPIDKLKIDQSFIRDIPNDASNIAITKTIITLAENLNLKVIAEGVETKQQADFLKNQNCQQVQGYLYSKPVPKEHIVLFK